MDGNYGGTLERRLAACDTAIFLDLPRVVCLMRVLKRRLQFHGRARPEMNSGCPERLSWEFLRWIFSYPTQRRPAILARLAGLRPDQRSFVLTSKAEMEQFLQAS
jgi:adenylate kinase family enzyme